MDIVKQVPKPLTYDLTDEDTKATVLVLLATLDGLSKVVLSGDQWMLAFYSAKDACLQTGMSEEQFCRIANKLNDYRRARKARNPMREMFDKD